MLAEAAFDHVNTACRQTPWQVWHLAVCQQAHEGPSRLHRDENRHGPTVFLGNHDALTNAVSCSG